MAYNTQLADRVREYLLQFPKLKIEENDHLNPLEKLRKEVEMKKQKIDNYMSHI